MFNNLREQYNAELQFRKRKEQYNELIDQLNTYYGNYQNNEHYPENILRNFIRKYHSMLNSSNDNYNYYTSNNATIQYVVKLLNSKQTDREKEEIIINYHTCIKLELLLNKLNSARTVMSGFFHRHNIDELPLLIYTHRLFYNILNELKDLYINKIIPDSFKDILEASFNDYNENWLNPYKNLTGEKDSKMDTVRPLV